MIIEPIAHIHTDFPTKFGVPRQSGLISDLKGTIIFEPHYRDPEAVKGLSGFNYIWLLWDFSMAHRKDWSATVCPPRLGGKTHVGVFATRSPFRPNNIGLSSVRLESIEFSDKGPILHVSGIDMMDNTPIYDIKPYIAAYDAHNDAVDGFTDNIVDIDIKVEDPEGLIAKSMLSDKQQRALIALLKEDPRPRFDAANDGSRKYGFYYCDYDVRFTVLGDILTIVEMPKVR